MTFLQRPEQSALYASDVERLGFVMNLSGLWAHVPSLHSGLMRMLEDAANAGGLTFRQRGVLVVATASALGDAYCSFAWGNRLAGVAGEEVAGAVLREEDTGLEPAERALADWARKVVRDPTGTGVQDLQVLRDNGYDDRQIFAVTVFVALRAAFAAVNDSLGAEPDEEIVRTAPAAVREAIKYP